MSVEPVLYPLRLSPLVAGEIDGSKRNKSFITLVWAIARFSSDTLGSSHRSGCGIVAL